ncbi:MAG: hypothetical protein ABSB74_14075 [Tepidisphaeraceae bacterium]
MKQKYIGSKRMGSAVGSKGSSGHSDPASRTNPHYPFYALCVELGENLVSLQIGKAYKVIRPEKNDPAYFFRVIDEEGEDYLYPREWFVPVELPLSAKRKLAAASL